METEWFNGELGAEKFAKLEPPRILKTHLPYELWKNQLDKHPDLKIIQTIRNPKDTLVSYYHHLCGDDQSGGFKGTWNQFFEVFQQKRLPWGDYFEHNAEWYKFNKNRKNSLILIYEEMSKDPKTHVAKIANFIGHEISENAVDLIVENSTVEKISPKFKEMYKNFPAWNLEKSLFVRKGVVGDWMNYFSTEQSEYVDAKCKEYLEPLELNFEYSL